MAGLHACFRIDWTGFSLDVDLDLPGSGITALFGRSGSGKTTVLRCIAGLERAPQGRLVLNDEVWQDRDCWVPTHKRPVGYVFQEASLFPHLSVMGNLRYGLRRISGAQRIALDPIIDLLGIGSLLDRRPDRLSGGESQRVGIARALAVNPHLLLMDEPLSALDAHRKAELLPFITALSQKFSVPILYVSHAMDEVLALADHLVLLEGGRAVASGPLEEVLARPDLRALFPAGEAGTVLRARILDHISHYGLTRLEFSGGPLLTTQVDLPTGAGVRVRIAARDIALSRTAPQQISTRNVLPATVMSVTEATDHRVDVLLHCGEARLWSQITALAQAELQLRPGETIFALIKAVTLTRESIAQGM